MKLHLASTAELYVEHRRTGSTRKRQRIAAELQRRHDEQNQRPGYPQTWWTWERLLAQGASIPGPGRWVQIFRFDFGVQLPNQKPSVPSV
ncbi:MAG TPA: hypothetical protein VNP98_17195 [Chthoniobacterales bacterium]|nr:hypothetical protein [Chthoniobacterales bacterium]